MIHIPALIPHWDDITVRSFAAELCGGTPQCVPLCERPLPFSNCYWNVDRKIKAEGGQMQVGWMMTSWPGVLLCAEHHAIWQRPGGELIDVTSKAGSGSATRCTLFVRDDSVSIDLDRPPGIRMRLRLLSDDPRVAEYARLLDLEHDCVSQLIELAYAMGYRCQQERAAAAGMATRFPIPRGHQVSQQYGKLQLRRKQILSDQQRLIAQLAIDPPTSQSNHLGY
jgi:hypothetical protein